MFGHVNLGDAWPCSVRNEIALAFDALIQGNRKAVPQWLSEYELLNGVGFGSQELRDSFYLFWNDDAPHIDEVAMILHEAAKHFDLDPSIVTPIYQEYDEENSSDSAYVFVTSRGVGEFPLEHLMNIRSISDFKRLTNTICGNLENGEICLRLPYEVEDDPSYAALERELGEGDADEGGIANPH